MIFNYMNPWFFLLGIAFVTLNLPHCFPWAGSVLSPKYVTDKQIINGVAPVFVFLTTCVAQ